MREAAAQTPTAPRRDPGARETSRANSVSCAHTLRVSPQLLHCASMVTSTKALGRRAPDTSAMVFMGKTSPLATVWMRQTEAPASATTAVNGASVHRTPRATPACTWEEGPDADVGLMDACGDWQRGVCERERTRRGRGAKCTPAA